MAKVPNTSTFALSDVIGVVSPTSNKQSACFTAAKADAFDSTYEGSKDRLSNFRNYFTIYADDTSFSWTATGIDYESTNVYTNSNPFSIDSKPAWITATVYDDGSLVVNPSGYNSGMELRLAPSTNTGAARSGSVELTDSTSVIFEIDVSQSAGVVQPTVVVEVASTESFTMTNLGGSISVGSTSFSFSFKDVSGWSSSASDMPFWIEDAGSNTVGSGTISSVKDGSYTWNKSTTISRNAVSGDQFTVYLGDQV